MAERVLVKGVMTHDAESRFAAPLRKQQIETCMEQFPTHDDAEIAWLMRCGVDDVKAVRSDVKAIRSIARRQQAIRTGDARLDAEPEAARVNEFGTVTRTGAAGSFQEAVGSIQNEASPRIAWDDLPPATQRSLVAAVEPLVNGRTLGKVLSAEDIAKHFRINLGRTWTGEPTPTTDTATTAGRVAATQRANEEYRRRKAAAGTQDAARTQDSGNKRPSVADIQARNEEYRAAKRSGRPG
jgi:hypothetical protein